MMTAKAKSKTALSAAGGVSTDKLSKRILVVEDEGDLQELVRFNLDREGFGVIGIEHGEQALRMARSEKPDLILLDLMLPGIDGLEVCRRLKADAETRDIPIVMMTAKGEETDIVVGLEMGADDYVTKPFSPRVLTARIRAVLRRPVGDSAAESLENEKPLQVGPLQILPERHEVRVENESIELTATEFRLLHLLAKRAGRVFTRQQVIDALHDGFAAVTDRSVDVQIVALRRKLGTAGGMIQTVRGVGYRLQEQEEA